MYHGHENGMLISLANSFHFTVAMQCYTDKLNHLVCVCVHSVLQTPNISSVSLEYNTDSLLSEVNIQWSQVVSNKYIAIIPAVIYCLV